VLVVFDSSRVDKRMLDLSPDLDQGEVDAVSADLLAATRGATLETAAQVVLDRARTGPAGRRAILERVAEALGSMAESREAEHVFFRGAAHIAAEEGFEGRDTLRGIFEALERETEVLQLLREASTTPAVRVTIGAESEVTGMWHASMIAAPYGPGEHPLGTIGVVGPTRMDYVSAISAVRAVAERLSAAVQALSG
jgi:heat-inducible transcriptional repressor